MFSRIFPANCEKELQIPSIAIDIYYDDFQLDSAPVYFEYLSGNQLIHLNQLNLRLCEAQTFLQQEALKSGQQLYKEIKSSQAGIDCFRITGILSLFPFEDDPHNYSEEQITDIEIDLGDGQKSVFNKLQNPVDNWCPDTIESLTELLTSKPCYLLQKLLFHPQLGLSNVLRINILWIDLIVTKQMRFSLSNNCAEHLGAPLADFPAQSKWLDGPCLYSHKPHYTEYYAPDTLNHDELTPLQIDFLKNLNLQLFEIHKSVIEHAGKLRSQLNLNLNSKTHWLEDFEIEGKYFFLLHESDRRYQTNKYSNILFAINYGLKKRKKSDDEIIKSLTEYNWNTFVKQAGHRLYRDFHSHLFHELIDHSDLGWINILRIGQIVVDLEIWHQRTYEINDSLTMQKN